jgi:hypothetical protein
MVFGWRGTQVGVMCAITELPIYTSLEELTGLLSTRRELYVRWSLGPERDLPRVSSTDDLTGVKLPGLSASPLDVEDWWGTYGWRVGCTTTATFPTTRVPVPGHGCCTAVRWLGDRTTNPW